MSWGKAGKTRWKGRRPKVRGEVMNPVDHPHGGRTRGGRNVVSPWGKKEGVKTRNKKKPSQRLIVRGGSAVRQQSANTRLDASNRSQPSKQRSRYGEKRKKGPVRSGGATKKVEAMNSRNEKRVDQDLVARQHRPARLRRTHVRGA